MLTGFEGRGQDPHWPIRAFHLLGTSGTVTTLAGVHLDLPRYDRRRVDGLWMIAASVDAMQRQAAGAGISPRASPIPASARTAPIWCWRAAPFWRRSAGLAVEPLRVADRGLREGMLTEMMADDGVWRRPRPRSHRGMQESPDGPANPAARAGRKGQDQEEEAG
jgi:exopolyphosphatase/guanosine-5'-triphosphate,3'-diphosphate pyrophosphatase